MTQLTNKQLEVMESFIKEQPKILVASGAKRAGKTFILIILFLMHIAKYEGKGLSFIIGGATQAAIRRNILNDMEEILQKELKLDKTNAIHVFGNKIYCFDGAQSDSWKKARGFTAAGAFLNEGTALNDMFVKEVISRCSYPGAKILIDTNPENPAHSVKKDYIDKDGQLMENGRVNIRAFNFSLFDNDKLDPEYVESIVAATPSGMFTDRDIYGRWVAAEGVIYKDFNKDNYISLEEFKTKDIVKRYCGVDWGYEHYGSIALIAEDKEGNIYIEEEHAHRHKDIDAWLDVAIEIKNKHGNIMFWCDSARPEYLAKFRLKGIRAANAKKAVIPGIEAVAKVFKNNKLRVVRDNVKRFEEEINMYVWNERTGEPVKEYDDFLDAVRYAIYTHNYNEIIRGKF